MYGFVRGGFFLIDAPAIDMLMPGFSIPWNLDVTKVIH
jgi:hypothetical protein